MKAQILYFDGCPSWSRALDNLIEALALEGRHVEIETIRVKDAADAEAKRFLGSPSIRIDGMDVEGASAEERGYAFACRVYTDGDQRRPWPSVARIREAVRRT